VPVRWVSATRALGSFRRPFLGGGGYWHLPDWLSFPFWHGWHSAGDLPALDHTTTCDRADNHGSRGAAHTLKNLTHVLLRLVAEETNQDQEGQHQCHTREAFEVLEQLKTIQFAVLVVPCLIHPCLRIL